MIFIILAPSFTTGQTLLDCLIENWFPAPHSATVEYLKMISSWMLNLRL